MDQKFLSFDDALEKLSISSERLNELREHGQLRAYRDGKSWKFRTDEIMSMVADGIPELPPPSDVSLVEPRELVAAEPIAPEDEELELMLVDEDDEDAEPLPEVVVEDMPDELDEGDTILTSGDLELGELEDTVTVGGSDVSLADEQGDLSDSILLSEEELGESLSGSPSTIIGKNELTAEDADLELAGGDATEDPGGEEVVQGPAASDVLSAGVVGSGVLDELTGSSHGASAFEDLEELEIDLAAESSRILSPSDVTKGKPADVPATGLGSGLGSDLILEDDSQLADETEMGSTDVPREASETNAGTGADEELDLELEGDDDALAEDVSESDLTLDSGDSGINLVAPVDSGLALDDIPLDMGGSAILSSLSLEGSDPEISLVGNESDVASLPEAELQTDDDFQLTPLSEGGTDEEGDSSSQVIALDAELEQLGEESLGGLEAVDFAEEGAADVMLSEDFAEAPAEDLGVAYGGAPQLAASAELPYTLGNVLLLGSCGFMLLLAGIMGLDLVRNMWGWNENLALNSSLMEAILSLLP